MWKRTWLLTANKKYVHKKHFTARARGSYRSQIVAKKRIHEAFFSPLSIQKYGSQLKQSDGYRYFREKHVGTRELFAASTACRSRRKRWVPQQVFSKKVYLEVRERWQRQNSTTSNSAGSNTAGSRPSAANRLAFASNRQQSKMFHDGASTKSCTRNTHNSVDCPF